MTLLGSIADHFMHVFYVMSSEFSVLLWDAVFTIAQNLGNLLLIIVRSGMLETVINFAVNILLIFMGQTFCSFSYWGGPCLSSTRPSTC